MFARELIAQLDTIKELPSEPEQGVREGERVIGELDDDLRRLYALREQYAIKVNKAAAMGMRFLADNVDRKRGSVDPATEQELGRLHRKLHLAEIQYRTVNSLFSASVKTRFPEAVCEDLQLRQGWKVVAVEDDTHVLAALLASSLFTL